MTEKLEQLSMPVQLAILVLLILLIAFALTTAINLIFKKLHFEKYLEAGKLKRLNIPIFVLLCLVSLKPLFNYFEVVSTWPHHLLHLLLIFVGAWLIIQALSLGRLALLRQYDVGRSDNLQARKVYTQVRMFERIVSVMVVILAMGMALMTFESIRQVGVSLLTSAGIAGIIVGLAAQKLIGNILAGLQIAITQPIRIDDVVIVENEWGKIEEITLTYVIINIWDKRRLVVPSNYFIEKPFQNWTRTTSELLGTVFIYTDYTMPVAPLRKALTNVLNGTDLWDGQVNVLQVTDTRNNTLELRALMSAKDAPATWDLRVHVREKLIEFLQQEFPQKLPLTRINLGEKAVDT